MIENRSVWGIILVVVVCGMLCMCAFADAGGEARFVRQMVGRDVTMRTFVWQSDVLDERMHLVYRRCGEDLLGEVCPTVERCAVGDDTFFRYRAELNGLVRGAEYEYAVTNDRPDAWHRFHVADSRYTALIFTDSQCSGDYHMWHEVVRTAKKEAASADLCLHLGDLVDCGASRYQWERWLTVAEEILLSCVFAPTVGNHEDYTTDWQMTLPHWYRALFPVVKNDDGELDGYVYSFDYGDVHYAVLDTQAEELSAWKDDWAARQTAWLKHDLAQSDARWKVVLCHKPFYEMDGTLTEHGKAWLPVCRKYGVRLVLSGHHHIYGRKVEGDMTIVTAGVSGDGTGYEVQGGGRGVQKRCDVPTYMTMTVMHDALRLRAIQADGAVIDEVMISSQE